MTLDKSEQICPTSGTGLFLFLGGAVLDKSAYGRGKHVETGTVVGSLMAIGQEVALACDANPTRDRNKVS